MEKWEYCFVDMLNHDVHYLTAEGMKGEKIRRNKSLPEDSKENATARFVALLGLAGWELVSAGTSLRPILYFKRKLDLKE